MPELPEVETVRRGLTPAMVGARFVKVEAHRPDLRRPLPNDFAGRLEGATVTALRRRAKYLLAELSSGDVLMMHLGMSGSFRVSGEDKAQTPGGFHYPRSEARAHDHVVFHMSSGARIVFNDPRRFGLMLLVPADELAEHALMKEVGPEPLDHAFDAAALARTCAGKATSLKAALLGPESRGRPRQHLCVRGAAPRAAFPEAGRGDDRDQSGRAQRTRGRAGRGDQGGAQGRDRGGRLVAAQLCAHRRRTRRLPAPLPRLRP